jgi:hypothetical protein
VKSGIGYFFGAIAIVAGFAMAGWLIWSGVVGLGNELTRLVVPGSKVLALDTPGTYTIYHETESVVEGRVYSADNISGLRVSVAAQDGQDIPVTTPTVNSSYTIGGHTGKSVFGFAVTQPGSYRLTAAYPGGRTEPQTVLAIGRNFVGGLVKTIFSAIGAVFAGIAVGLTLVLTTYFRRRRLRMVGAI